MSSPENTKTQRISPRITRMDANLKSAIGNKVSPGKIFHQALPGLPIKLRDVFYPHAHGIGNRVGH